MEGLGVPRDYAQAYFWLSLWGGVNAAARAKEHLSDDEASEVDTLVKDWQEQHHLSPEVEAAWNIPN